MVKWVVAIIFVLSCIVSFTAGRNVGWPEGHNQTFNVADCVDRYTYVDPSSDDKTYINRSRSSDLCNRIAYSQYSLNDFNIRRVKFIQQQYDEYVILWLVVIITISGVILAGLQLSIGYRLADSQKSGMDGQGAEITVENNKLVFKSSVTGLAILLISFAFFLVFALEIFVIREVKPEGLSGGNQAQGGATVPGAATLKGGYN
ncbi:hypothetical protein [Azorhizobium sp. AG788]|uniref:hypothetical protein n=1 Tax=Azorhizobium sp. AG788 TaxID=2183897 RepID=UPI0031388DE8